jgi:GNAT superfamily N-acetyltransferase
MIHADLALAQRLESVAAAQCRAFVETHQRLYPSSAAAHLECAGGAAVFFDDVSPLTQIKGAGMSPPTMESDIDAAEEFFRERSAPVTFVLTPFTDPALATYLSRRGYELGAFENAMVRPLSPGEFEPDPDVEEATQAEPFNALLAEAFFDANTAAAHELFNTLFHVPTTSNFTIASAAAAQLDIVDGVATFQCDGAIRRYRNAGLQKKLIRHRLALAAAAGCDLATAEVQPGSVSQANFEKCGFRVAYTKLTLLKPPFE